jgi:hypothetical protein
LCLAQKYKFIHIALRPSKDTFHHLTNCSGLQLIVSATA